MSNQLGVLGPKSQDLAISFCIGKGENILQSHLRALQIRSENFLLQDETVQINNLTSKYITEQSKLKFFQRYMTTFEIYYRNFEQIPQSHQLSTISQYTI